VWIRLATSVPDPWVGAAFVKAGSTLTWDQLVSVVNATNGERISPGILQTLISTARSMLPWLNALQPNIFTALGNATTPATAGGFLNDWLINAGRSILVGAAYIRQGYNLNGTRFDLPLVGSAYNHGHPESDAASPWGLTTTVITSKVPRPSPMLPRPSSTLIRRLRLRFASCAENLGRQAHKGRSDQHARREVYVPLSEYLPCRNLALRPVLLRRRHIPRQDCVR